MVAMPAGQYTGGPQDLPGGYNGSAGTIPGGYPGQIKNPEARGRALNVEIQYGRAAMLLGVIGCIMHSCLDSCDHHFFYPITHVQSSVNCTVICTYCIRSKCENGVFELIRYRTLTFWIFEFDGFLARSPLIPSEMKKICNYYFVNICKTILLL